MKLKCGCEILTHCDKHHQEWEKNLPYQVCCKCGHSQRYTDLPKLINGFYCAGCIE